MTTDTLDDAELSVVITQTIAHMKSVGVMNPAAQITAVFTKTMPDGSMMIKVDMSVGDSVMMSAMPRPHLQDNTPAPTAPSTERLQ